MLKFGITLPRSLRGKTFLITGGAGFIGSHIADALIARGGKVIIVDDLSTGRKENINPKARFYKINIADGKQLDLLMRRYKDAYIYHLAYHSSVPRSVKDPLINIDDLRGSINILQAAKKYGIKKIIFFSSGFIYGNTVHFPTKETESHDPCSPYGITKYTIEGYLHFYKRNFGIDFVILRPAAVYGPRQIMGAMAAYIRDLNAEAPTEFYGKKTRDYVYIDDVVDISLRAITIPASHKNPIFNVGTGRREGLIDLYATLAKLLGKKKRIVQRHELPGELNKYCLDVAKAKKELGWKPKIDFEEGLRRTLVSWGLILTKKEK